MDALTYACLFYVYFLSQSVDAAAGESIAICRPHLSENAMNPCKVSQIIFSQTYIVPPEQTTQQVFRLLPHASGHEDRMLDAMATGYLVAVLESICVHEMQPYLDHDEELVVGSPCNVNRAPIPAGALVRVDGWVAAIGNRKPRLGSGERRPGNRVEGRSGWRSCSAIRLKRSYSARGSDQRRDY